jgi:hypothetical protein
MSEKQSEPARSEDPQLARLEERLERLRRRTSELRSELTLRGEEAVQKDASLLEEEMRRLQGEVSRSKEELDAEASSFRRARLRFVDEAHRLSTIVATMSLGALAFSISSVTAFSGQIVFRSWLGNAWVLLTASLVLCAVERFAWVLWTGYSVGGNTSSGWWFGTAAAIALGFAFAAFIFGVVALLVFGLGNLYAR